MIFSSFFALSSSHLLHHIFYSSGPFFDLFNNTWWMIIPNFITLSFILRVYIYNIDNRNHFIINCLETFHLLFLLSISLSLIFYNEYSLQLQDVYVTFSLLYLFFFLFPKTRQFYLSTSRNLEHSSKDD